ncbi:MAG: hypothetical protein ACXVRZ_14155 [Gaiellaceae bacterium]
MTAPVETRERAAVFVIHQVGVDQIRVMLSLAGESARLCELLTDHDWRPRGIPNMGFVGRVRQDGFKKVFDHLLGDAARLLYHRDSRHLHVDIHFARLASVDGAVRRTQEIVSELARQGFESSFPVRVARADCTGDVIFSSSAHFRYTASAFRAMLCERGRVVEPFRSSTLLEPFVLVRLDRAVVQECHPAAARGRLPAPGFHGRPRRSGQGRFDAPHQ